MKKWYIWLILALIFALDGVQQFISGGNVLSRVIQVVIAVVLAITQYICDKKGERGVRVFKYICMVLTIIIVTVLLFLIIKTFLI